MSILSQLTGAQETGKWYTFQEFGVVESELTDKTNMPIILVQFDRSYHDKPMQLSRVANQKIYGRFHCKAWH